MRSCLPNISVIVPCHNPGTVLIETVSSALNQSLPPHEVLVVDDGSTDGSTANIQSLSPVVRVIRQPNLGSSAARNCGIAQARGEFLALIDHDDVWDPLKLEKQFEVFQLRPDLVCVYSDFYRFRDGERLETISQPECGASSDYKVAMLCACMVLPSTAIIRTEVARREVFPSQYGPYAEDAIYFLTLRKYGEFLKIPEALVGYRVSPQQQSATHEYFLNSVRARLQWLEDNSNEFSSTEYSTARRGLASRLLEIHDLAYWSRDMQVAAACRRLFMDVDDNSIEPSKLFTRPLLPTWIWKIKDAFDRVKTRCSAR